ncbi:MAG: hypothetical protein ACRBN8_07965 [Nannocystales bacterium]
MKRRSFIKSAASATAVAGAGVFSILKYPRGASAAGWGAWPMDDKAKAAAFLPTELQPEGVLELHVNGGMSCFDTFYTIPEFGQDDFRFMHVFDEASPASEGRQAIDTLQGRWDSCQTGYAEMTQPLGATDADGNELHLGPWTWPFWSRPDVIARMRIVVTAHDQVAHEGANPKSFTGLGLGNPRMAGLGTAIQRYFTENEDGKGGGGIRPAPYSYVLSPAGYAPFNAVAASSVGAHPGSARPLVVSVEPDSELTNLLARTAIDNPDAFDDAVAYYRAEYTGRLKSFGHSTAARSAERANYDFSAFARENAPVLTDILSSDLFNSIAAPAQLCQTNMGVADNMPAMQARLASSLLTREQNAARYVLWIDAGIQPRPTGGHDVHAASVRYNATNYSNTFSSLLDQIVDPMNPRDGDENRIDLDRQMVVINTEFGRQPFQQGNGTGTNHHPGGYVQMFIGGPMSHPSLPNNLIGPSVYGAMSETDGFATTAVSPAQSRMMVLQSLGIYPFSTQSYNVSDGGYIDEVEAATAIRDEFLGLEGVEA